MPDYEFVCPHCGHLDDKWAPISEGPPAEVGCLRCGQTMRRHYTPPATPVPFQPHFNHSVGAWVASEREFRDKLKQGSEEMSAKMGGMPVNFEPIPVAEVHHDEQGLEAGRKARRDRGRDEPRKTYH